MSKYTPSSLDRRGVRESRPDEEILRRLIQEVPDDTRTLTGRLLGDPLPGRRAIDKRSAASG
jgi:hypothetical protein